jgi:predicted nucleic acid-binding protein
MKLFADTGSWVGIFDHTDPLRQIALPAFDRLLTEKAVIYTTDYVIAESITFLTAHRYHRVAVEFGLAVQSSPSVRITHVDSDLWQTAWSLFQKYDDKEFSFTDCTSFVVMQQLNITDVFGFDHHFEQMGFRLWPRAVR